MSHAAPWGRAMPRWSVPRHGPSAPSRASAPSPRRMSRTHRAMPAKSASQIAGEVVAGTPVMERCPQIEESPGKEAVAQGVAAERARQEVRENAYCGWAENETDEVENEQQNGGGHRAHAHGRKALEVFLSRWSGKEFPNPRAGEARRTLEELQ